jgi:hypothetical protein
MGFGARAGAQSISPPPITITGPEDTDGQPSTNNFGEAADYTQLLGMVEGVPFWFVPWEITRAKLMLGWIAKERALEMEVSELLKEVDNGESNAVGTKDPDGFGSNGFDPMNKKDVDRLESLVSRCDEIEMRSERAMRLRAMWRPVRRRRNATLRLARAVGPVGGVVSGDSLPPAPTLGAGAGGTPGVGALGGEEGGSRSRYVDENLIRWSVDQCELLLAQEVNQQLGFGNFCALELGAAKELLQRLSREEGLVVKVRMALANTSVSVEKLIPPPPPSESDVEAVQFAAKEAALKAETRQAQGSSQLNTNADLEGLATSTDAATGAAAAVAAHFAAKALEEEWMAAKAAIAELEAFVGTELGEIGAALSLSRSSSTQRVGVAARVCSAEAATVLALARGVLRLRRAACDAAASPDALLHSGASSGSVSGEAGARENEWQRLHKLLELAPSSVESTRKSWEAEAQRRRVVKESMEEEQQADQDDSGFRTGEAAPVTDFGDISRPLGFEAKHPRRVRSSAANPSAPPVAVTAMCELAEKEAAACSRLLLVQSATEQVVVQLEFSAKSADEEWLFHALAQARRLRLSAHPNGSIRAVVSYAKDLLAYVKDTKRELRRALIQAGSLDAEVAESDAVEEKLDAVSAGRLSIAGLDRALARVDSLRSGGVHDQSRAGVKDASTDAQDGSALSVWELAAMATELRHWVGRVSATLDKGLRRVDARLLRRALIECADAKVELDGLADARRMLRLSPTDMHELQLKQAVAERDVDRAARLTMRMRANVLGFGEMHDRHWGANARNGQDEDKAADVATARVAAGQKHVETGSPRSVAAVTASLASFPGFQSTAEFAQAQAQALALFAPGLRFIGTNGSVGDTLGSGRKDSAVAANASTSLVGEMAREMLRHSVTPLYSPLTHALAVKTNATGTYSREGQQALRLFRCIQRAMGDRDCPYPQLVAEELLSELNTAMIASLSSVAGDVASKSPVLPPASMGSTSMYSSAPLDIADRLIGAVRCESPTATHGGSGSGSNHDGKVDRGDAATVGSRTCLLVDEVYCQLMKQLTANPSVISERKGWLLMRRLLEHREPAGPKLLPSETLEGFVEQFLCYHGRFDCMYQLHLGVHLELAASVTAS